VIRVKYGLTIGEDGPVIRVKSGVVIGEDGYAVAEGEAKWLGQTLGQKSTRSLFSEIKMGRDEGAAVK
jgi:hypothetical protein